MSTVKRAQTTLGQLQDLQVVCARSRWWRRSRDSSRLARRASRAFCANDRMMTASRARTLLCAAGRLAAACATTRRQIVPSLAARAESEYALDEGPSKRPYHNRRSLMADVEPYLIRHGLAAERGEAYDDSKRPLTSCGIARLRKEARRSRSSE